MSDSFTKRKFGGGFFSETPYQKQTQLESLKFFRFSKEMSAGLTSATGKKLNDFSPFQLGITGFYYKSLPEDQDPSYVSVFREALNRSPGAGKLMGAKTLSDLEWAARAGLQDSLKNLLETSKAPLGDSIIKGFEKTVAQLRQNAGFNDPNDFLNNFETVQITVKVNDYKDPRLVPDSLVGHSLRDLPDDVQHRGFLRSFTTANGGKRYEIFMHGGILAQYAIDSDGDDIQLLVFKPKNKEIDEGGAYALWSKPPNVRRGLGIDLLNSQDFDIVRGIARQARDPLSGIPARSALEKLTQFPGDGEFSQKTTAEIFGISEQLKYQEIKRKIRSNGYEALSKEEQAWMTEQVKPLLEGNSKVGTVTSQLYTEDIHNSLLELSKSGQINNMTPEQLNEEIAKRFRRGGKAFDVLELGFLKNISGDDDARIIDYMLGKIGRTFVTGFKDLSGKLTPAKSLELLALAAKGNIPINEISSSSVRDLVEIMANPLAAVLKDKKSFEQRPFRDAAGYESWIRQTFVTDIAQQQDGSTFDDLVKAGFIDVKEVDLDYSHLSPEAKKLHQGMYAIHRRNILGKVTGLDGGGATKASRTSIVRAGVLPTILMGSLDGPEVRSISGRDAIRRQVNANVENKIFSIKAGGRDFNIRIGGFVDDTTDLDGNTTLGVNLKLLATDRAATQSLASRLIESGEGISLFAGESQLSELLKKAKPDSEVGALAEVLRDLAKIAIEEEKLGGESKARSDLLRIVGRIAATDKKGSRVIEEAMEVITGHVSKYGQHADMFANEGMAGLSPTSSAARRVLSNEVIIAANQRTSQPENFVRMMGHILGVTDITLGVKDMEDRQTVRGFLGDDFGQPFTPLGLAPKRAPKVSSQVLQGRSFGAKVAYIALDPINEMLQDNRFAGMSANDILAQFYAYDKDEFGNVISEIDPETNRLKGTGQGQAFTTPSLQAKFQSVIEGTVMPHVKIEDMSIEDFTEDQIKKFNIRYVSNPTAGGALKRELVGDFDKGFFTAGKLVSRSGAIKIEGTRISQVFSGAEQIDALIDVGEMGAKSKAKWASVILESAYDKYGDEYGADTNQMIYERLQSFSKTMESIEKSGGDLDGRQRASNELLEWAGLRRTTLSATSLDGTIEQIPALVFEGQKELSISTAAVEQMLNNTPKMAQSGGATTQFTMSRYAEQFIGMFENFGIETGVSRDQLYSMLFKNIKEAYQESTAVTRREAQTSIEAFNKVLQFVRSQSPGSVTVHGLTEGFYATKEAAKTAEAYGRLAGLAKASDTNIAESLARSFTASVSPKGAAIAGAAGVAVGLISKFSEKRREQEESRTGHAAFRP